MVANLRDTFYGIFEEYKNSASDICNMVEVTSSSGGVHGHSDRHDDFSSFETYTSQLIGSVSSKLQLDLYLEETQLDHRLHEDLNVMGWPLLPLFTSMYFQKKPYELMGDRFTESISILGDYFADCPYEFNVMFKLFIFHKVSVLHSRSFVY
ncbi:hypothetical protein SO802_015809 [Lithocarpus litseifolius]|uniref:Uncharacterized protein n=1 Tax=Lithocarpus litseifolius TaxID=425828 RepID=A0AAW2CUQ9_9ROSI